MRENMSGSMQERTLYIPFFRLLETPRPGFTMLVKNRFPGLHPNLLNLNVLNESKARRNFYAYYSLRNCAIGNESLWLI